MERTIRMAFILMALLIVVAYFVGAATETNALANGITKITYALTGRNAAGNFAAYPGGGGAIQLG